MIWNSQFMNQLSWWHRFPSDEYTKPPRKPFHTVDHSWPVINKKHTIIKKHIKGMFCPMYQISIKCKGSIMAIFLTFVDWKLRPAYIILVAVVISAKAINSKVCWKYVNVLSYVWFEVASIAMVSLSSQFQGVSPDFS